MSFSDNLGNDLKNLEKQDEPIPSASRGREAEADPACQRARGCPSFGEPEEQQLHFRPVDARHSDRSWIAHEGQHHVARTTLRLQAREHRMELRPGGDGITAHFFVNEKEIRRQKVDMAGDPEPLAKEWLDTVGRRPSLSRFQIWNWSKSVWTGREACPTRAAGSSLRCERRPPRLYRPSSPV